MVFLAMVIYILGPVVSNLKWETVLMPKASEFTIRNDRLSQLDSNSSTQIVPILSNEWQKG